MNIESVKSLQLELFVFIFYAIKTTKNRTTFKNL